MPYSAGASMYAPGLISVTGVDAGSFLRAQLTHDVTRLDPGQHTLAAWCDAKGRTVMLARVLHTPTNYLLIVPRALIDPMLKRLHMYVLRARVELTAVTARYRIDGLSGSNLPAANTSRQDGERLILGLPCGSGAPGRALAIAPVEAPPPANALATDDSTWQLAAVDAGIPAILPQTRGLFVPQMINLHWLKAIDFDKGCYPGQEVIARLHYRGRLTRRLFRLAWFGGSQPAPGSDIQDASGAAQGTVVHAASDAGHASSGRLLAVVKLASAQAQLRTGDTRLEMLDLPYPTPDD